ncbi:TRAP transporter substrate-binding protein DctP [Planococcus salinus]|uniref:DctP family TRAP transporter solute-binding subunit n=1 Tax=Planococcus salinus TaxID=1848460 RepID=A0A3M8P8J5_9BACL|nr:TRAP transporter substrate-binding protein DctP [Planococcus salinus]RNF39983.1 DctP family TRAP transporter solute-binding subunit [Planococcus salinus]
MFTKKKMSLFLVLFLASMVLMACGGGSEEGSGDGGESASSGDENINIRFAHEEGQGDVQDLYVNEFKNRVEEQTDGRITVDVYTAGTLGGNSDMFTQLQTGAIDFAISSPGFTGTIIPQTQIMAVPFLFSDNMEVNKKVLDESEALYGTLAEKYEEKGLKPFKFWLEGFMYWTANKPITEPEDMKGMKMRGMPTDLIMESYRQMGADPQGTDSGEIYTMLQTGGIDGQENPLFYIYSSNFYEVQDYLMDSKHHIYTTVTVANSDWFSTLAEEDQTLIEDTIQEVNDWSFTMQQEEQEKAMAEIEKSDIEIIELTTEQRDAFKELSAPVRDAYVESGGEGAQEILETIEADIEAAEEELN